MVVKIWKTIFFKKLIVCLTGSLSCKTYLCLVAQNVNVGVSVLLYSLGRESVLGQLQKGLIVKQNLILIFYFSSWGFIMTYVLLF